MRRALPICCVLSASGLSATSVSAEQRLGVAVEYQAPAVCPNAEAFWDALIQRTRRVERAEGGAAEVQLRLNLQQTQRGILGRLDIVRDGFATEPRYVEAQECEGVLQALALTAALGIDPEALTRPPDEEPEPLPPSPRSRSGNYYYDAPDPLPSTPLNWSTSLVFRTLAALPVDLRTSWGLAGGVSFRSDGSPNWAPAVTLGASALRSDVFSDDIEARFALYSGFARACPLRLHSAGWGLRPCFAMEAGVLTAAGSNISNPEGTTNPWVAMGVELEVEYAFSTSWALQLNLAGLAPITPQRYRLGTLVEVDDGALTATTDEEIARTPALAPWLGLGIVNTL